jgi:hypothetical protein
MSIDKELQENEFDWEYYEYCMSEEENNGK